MQFEAPRKSVYSGDQGSQSVAIVLSTDAVIEAHWKRMNHAFRRRWCLSGVAIKSCAPFGSFRPCLESRVFLPETRARRMKPKWDLLNSKSFCRTASKLVVLGVGGWSRQKMFRYTYMYVKYSMYIYICIYVYIDYDAYLQTYIIDKWKWSGRWLKWGNFWMSMVYPRYRWKSRQKMFRYTYMHIYIYIYICDI